MTLKLDHIIIAVQDLDQTMKDYHMLGFNVFFGGEHASGTTHNALVCFHDGSYLELIAPTGSEPKDDTMPDYRVWFDELGWGVIGFALYSKHLDGDLDKIRARGMAIEDARDGGRLREDGKALRWRTTGTTGRFFPFLIEDVTPRALRVPNHPDALRQPNEVIEVMGLDIAVTSLTDATTYYQKLLGSEPIQTGITSTFTMSGTKLTLRNGADVELPARILLKTTSAIEIGQLSNAQTHGANIILVE